jgi:putative transposase
VDFSGRIICSGRSDEKVAIHRVANSGGAEEGEAGVPVAQIMRKHGISQATYYNWKSKYGGASAAELKRLKELEAENAKLKRMYADLALENAAIKEVLTRKL